MKICLEFTLQSNHNYLDLNVYVEWKGWESPQFHAKVNWGVKIKEIKHILCITINWLQKKYTKKKKVLEWRRQGNNRRNVRKTKNIMGGKEGLRIWLKKGTRVGNLGRTICGFGYQNKHKEKSTASI
jgi:hypothetical protein